MIEKTLSYDRKARFLQSESLLYIYNALSLELRIHIAHQYEKLFLY
jgi:hypothetical protein